MVFDGRYARMESHDFVVKPIGIIRTPLLDIKPYVKRFDSQDNVRSGWQDQVHEDDAKIRGRRDYDG